jgi:hypothetical protein
MLTALGKASLRFKEDRIWLAAGLVGLIAMMVLLINQPNLQFTYSPEDLSQMMENGQARGFYKVQQDEAGNRYLWTTKEATLTEDFQTTKPLKFSFELRSAAVAGGPDAPVQILVNGSEAGQIRPDPTNPNFQKFELTVTPPPSDKTTTEVKLVSQPYAPPSDGRTLGTMLKSISLDKSEAWSTVQKRLWLYLLLLFGLALGLLARLRPWRWIGYGAVAVTLAGSAGMALILALLRRLGPLEPRLWLAGTVLLILLFTLVALKLPLNQPEYADLAHYLSAFGKTVLKIVRGKRLSLMQGLKVFLLYGLICLGLMAPSASSLIYLPDTLDLPSHVSLIVQARMALEEGQFPIRVAPWQYEGWRLPYYQYYGQLPDTLGGLIFKYLTPDNPYPPILILSWLALVLGAFYIYRLSYWLTRSQPVAILSGAFYITAPYSLINVHARGAFTESMGQGVLAVVLYYTFRCYSNPAKYQILIGGLAWFMLAATHTITFVYSSLFVGGLVIYLSIPRLQRRKTWQRMVRVGLAYAFGWLLTLYYLGPLILEQSHLRIQEQLPNPFQFKWLTPLSGLLSPTSVIPEPGFSERKGVLGLHPAVGWPLLAVFLVVAYYYFPFKKVHGWPHQLRRTSRYVLGLMAIFVIAFFMAWSPFDFWSYLPKPLLIAQFPFRLLSQLVWAGALLAGYALLLVFRRLDNRHVVLGLLILGFACSSYLPSFARSQATPTSILASPDIGPSRSVYLYSQQSWSEIYGNQNLAVINENSTLIVNKEFEFPSWSVEEKPVLNLKAIGAGDKISRNLKLLINDQVVDQLPLETYSLQWQLPLDKVVLDGPTFRMKFLIEPDGPLYIQNFSLTNLSPAHSLIPVSETEKSFVQQGQERVGQITIAEKESELVQLPVLYYPQMLEVRVDGQKVNYVPTGNWYETLVGLKLSPGQHKITAKFVGLEWANWISLISWLGLLLGLLILTGQTVNKAIYKTRQDNRSTEQAEEEKDFQLPSEIRR